MMLSFLPRFFFFISERRKVDLSKQFEWIDSKNTNLRWSVNRLPSTWFALFYQIMDSIEALILISKASHDPGVIVNISCKRVKYSVFDYFFLGSVGCKYIFIILSWYPTKRGLANIFLNSKLSSFIYYLSNVSFCKH